MMKLSSFLTTILTIFCLYFFSTPANALKVNTHVWIAQEIIDDLSDDGKLTIYIDGEPFEVSPINSQKILQFPDEFRAGSVGPDAAPDVLIGQVLIHPGSGQDINNPWGTDKWYQYLNNLAQYNNEISYTQGFLVHMASDVVSHTYVNMYSGGIFNLGEEDGDLESERRHFLLESYIGNYTPGLSSGKEPWEVVSLPLYGTNTKETNDDNGGGDTYDPCSIGTKCTGDWQLNKTGTGSSNIGLLQNAFFYDPSSISHLVSTYGSSSEIKYPLVDEYEVFKQYSNNPGAQHIKAIYDLRYRIEQLIHSPVLAEMDQTITKYVIYYWTDGEYMPSDNEAEIFHQWHQEVKALEYDSNEAIQAVKAELEDFLQNSTIKVNGVTEDLASSLEELNSKLFGITSDILDLKDKINNLKSDIDDALCPSWDPICNEVNDLKDKLHAAESDLERKIIEFASTQTLLSDTLEHLHEVMQTVNLVRRSVDDVVYDLASVLLLDVNPIRALLKNWANGIDSAMKSYQLVGLEMMKEAMKTDGSVTQPLKDWAIERCNIKKLIGMGDDLSESQCRLKHSIEALKDELGFITTLLQTGDPLLAEIKSQIDDVISAEVAEVRNRVRDQLIDDLLEELPDDLEQFLRVVQSKNNGDHALNNEFEVIEEGVLDNYLKIPDIASRIKSEMRVETDQLLCKGKDKCFDKNKYPVIYNAVNLSKLALLDPYELTRIEEKLGVSPGSLSREVNSLLVGSVKNIDGNHHWYGNTNPPYPRSPEQYTNYYWSYDDFGSTNPFLMGSNYDREKVLNSIFIGPLVEGLFTPVSLGNYPPLLTKEYLDVYSSCNSKPFLRDRNDTSCANEYELTHSPFNPAMIPIISLILN